MATIREYKRCLQPILSAVPDWLYSRATLLHRSIGFYERGCAFQTSFSSRNHCKVVIFVYPLFESPRPGHVTWGRSHAIPGTVNHNWSIFDPDFSRQVAELIETAVAPVTQNVNCGAAFLDYLEREKISHGWPEWAKALAHAHMGNLDIAQALLIKPADILRSQFPHICSPDMWGYDLLEMLRLLEHDRDAIPAHCKEIARRSVKANKLEKHWTPTPFVYGGS